MISQWPPLSGTTFMIFFNFLMILEIVTRDLLHNFSKASYNTFELDFITEIIFSAPYGAETFI